VSHDGDVIRALIPGLPTTDPWGWLAARAAEADEHPDEARIEFDIATGYMLERDAALAELATRDTATGYTIQRDNSGGITTWGLPERQGRLDDREDEAP